MNERNHVDIFTGLGGFSLAAQANGVRTIAMCECDPRCQAFLAKAWPGVPVWPDVRTFSLADACRTGSNNAPEEAPQESNRDGQDRGIHQRGIAGQEPCGVAHAQCSERRQKAQGRNEHNGNEGRREEAASGHSLYPEQVWLLTAGVPCQPASRAGKQRGKEDDRWLWDSALTVFAAIRPAWAIFENPPGLQDLFEYGVQLEVDGDGNSTEPVGTVVERDGSGVFSGILDAIEAQGYAVKTLGIPACAVGAPHRRMRYWILAKRVGQADSRQPGCEGPDAEPGAERLHSEYPQGECCMANPGGINGGERRAIGPEQAPGGWTRPEHAGFPAWKRFVWLPCADGKVRRAPSDTQRMAHGLPVELLEGLASDIEAQLEKGDHFTPHRSLLGALGNSIVWPVAAKIIEAMILSENESE